MTEEPKPTIALDQVIQDLNRYMRYPGSLHPPMPEIVSAKQVIDRVPEAQRQELADRLGNMKAGRSVSIMVDSEDNWAMILCMIGPQAGKYVPRVWQLAEQVMRHAQKGVFLPDPFATLTAALALRQDSLKDIVPDVVKAFKEYVESLPSPSSGGLTKGDLLVSSCLVCTSRLLAVVGPPASASLPSLRAAPA